MKKFYSAISIFAAIVCTQLATAQCDWTGYPTPNLGNDTTICQGQSLPLNPGNGYNTYLWDNGSTNPTRYVTQSGTYSVSVGIVGANAIINGDFEAGNTSFSTDYIYATGTNSLYTEGRYSITTSPKLVHNDFVTCQDHTPDPGDKMMVINGAGTPNTKVWCQTVPVDPDTDYQFGTWASSAVSGTAVAQLQFSINNATIGTVFSPSTSACNWGQFFQIWNSGINVSAEICIVNQNTLLSGNDFMIDDITFTPICHAEDEIVVIAVPAPVITSSATQTICAGETAQLTANSTNTNLTYVWNPGALNGQTVSVSPAVSTVYSVIGTTPEGCVSNISSSSVLVRPSPVLTVTGSEDTLCKGESLQLTVSSNIAGTTYQWALPGGTADTWSDIPAVSTTYSVTATSPIGCQSTQSYAVIVIPTLDVSITGSNSMCDGDFVTLYAQTNIPGTSYAWAPVSSIIDSVVITSGNAGWVYLTGSYLDCPTNTDSVLVSVQPNPSITVPNNFLVCPGESVVATVSSDQPGSEFFWMPGNLNGSSNVLSSETTMTYYVYAYNGNCVSPIDSFTVDMSANCFLEVPNVFTPNGDNQNDFFQLISFNGIQSLECIIVNRWGNEVRTFDKPDFTWDGKDKSGNEVTPGTYFYKINAVTSGNQELAKSGFVELVRK